MKKLVVVAVAAFGLSLASCGSPCGDLEEQCDACDGLGSLACEIVVAADDSDACQAALDSKAYEKDSVACTGVL